MDRLKNKFKPDMFIKDIYKLDLSDMKNRGIKAFIFDIDNTLVTYDDAVAPRHTADWFSKLHSEGFKTYIVSNNNQVRVKGFAQSLGEPYFYKALKPKKKYLIKACEGLNVRPGEAALVGDQLFTDILGGNRMGMFTILVEAISDKEDWFVHLKRRLEKYLLKDWL